MVDNLADIPRLHSVRLDHAAGAAVEGGCPAAFAAKGEACTGRRGGQIQQIRSFLGERATREAHLEIKTEG